MGEAVAIPMTHGLLLAAMLFSIGLLGVLVRRNIILILISQELKLNASGLAFNVAGAHWGNAEGHIMFMFILSIAAAEVSIALGLLLQVHRRFRSLDIDQASGMRG